jgi:hypothetical protein
MDCPPTLKLPLVKFQECYEKIIQICQDAPVAAIIEPIQPDGWSIKDILAHLAAWNWRCASLVDAARNTDWPLKAEPDVAGLTQEFYRERQHWSWPEVEIDFCRAHQALMRTLQELPPERQDNPLILRTVAEEALKYYLNYLPRLEHWHREVTLSYY